MDAGQPTQPSIQESFEAHAASGKPMPDELQLPDLKLDKIPDVPLPPPSAQASNEPLDDPFASTAADPSTTAPEETTSDTPAAITDPFSDEADDPFTTPASEEDDTTKADPAPNEPAPPSAPVMPSPEEQQVKQPATLAGLQAQLKELKETRLKTLMLPNGEPAVTKKDLVNLVSTIPEEEFKQRQAASEFSDWIKRHLLDSDLASRIHDANTKAAALTLLKAATPPTAIHAPEKPFNHHDVDEHFAALAAAHEQTMQDLASTVSGKETPKNPSTIKELLLTKDHETAEHLHDFLQALALTDDQTYQDLVTNRKDELEARIKELAQKAARIAKLNPQVLQAQIQRELQEHDEQVKQLLAEKKAHLKEEAENLITREDELRKQEQELKNTEDLMEQEEHLLEERERQWADELKKELLTIDEQARQQQAFIKDQEAVLKQAADERAALDQRSQHVREQEVALMEHKKEQEVDFLKREAALNERETQVKDQEVLLEEREAALAADKQAHEEQMQKREALVQETVDKIIAIDNEIHEERDHVKAMQDGLDRLGFQKLLQRELQKLHHLPHLNLEEEEERPEGRELNALIDACSEAIENKTFDQAKSIYVKLKTFYEERTLDKEEREIAYEALQQLYTNLHLAMLEN